MELWKATGRIPLMGVFLQQSGQVASKSSENILQPKSLSSLDNVGCLQELLLQVRKPKYENNGMIFALIFQHLKSADPLGFLVDQSQTTNPPTIPRVRSRSIIS